MFLSNAIYSTSLTVSLIPSVEMKMNSLFCVFPFSLFPWKNFPFSSLSFTLQEEQWGGKTKQNNKIKYNLESTHLCRPFRKVESLLVFGFIEFCLSYLPHDSEKIPSCSFLFFLCSWTWTFRISNETENCSDEIDDKIMNKRKVWQIRIWSQGNKRKAVKLSHSFSQLDVKLYKLYGGEKKIPKTYKNCWYFHLHFYYCVFNSQLPPG